MLLSLQSETSFCEVSSTTELGKNGRLGEVGVNVTCKLELPCGTDAGSRVNVKVEEFGVATPIGVDSVDVLVFKTLTRDTPAGWSSPAGITAVN